MDTIKVKATEGRMMPLQGNPKRYVSAEPMDVPNTRYYRMAIKRGDIEVVTANAPSKKKEK